MADTDAHKFLAQIWPALTGQPNLPATVEFSESGPLHSAFAVQDFAAASIATAGLAAAQLIGAPKVTINKRRAALWFDMTLQPQGWTIPPAWDDLAGDYQTADGWIKLHTNAPHHKQAALNALFTDTIPADLDKASLATSVAKWQSNDLETAIINRGGCAATMRSQADWAAHPQGEAVGKEPLFRRTETGSSPRTHWQPNDPSPLSGIRVLDLTRILAGPVATRFLAGLGADVLRLDPPGWDEPFLAPEITLGKNCARLDLTNKNDRRTFTDLLTGADIIVHGYRADALENLGFGTTARQALCPGLIDICLNAYGWTGPWKNRRGFDSLVQMSTGIAAQGMTHFDADKPTPLPLQALDHATGYLLAAAALHGLYHRQQHGTGLHLRTSLARVAMLLTSLHPTHHDDQSITIQPDDFAAKTETTGWGPARRIAPPLSVDGTGLTWSRIAGPLGSASPAWQSL